jgi:hypothetical protein
MKIRDWKIRHAVVGVICLSAVTAHAQAPSAPSDPQQRIERLATLLDLDDSQKLAVQAVLEEQGAQMEAARAGLDLRSAADSAADAGAARADAERGAG